MKKVLMISIVLILTASWSFAADFSPTVLTLTGEDQIQYDFDGTDLMIPFSVEGTPAAVWLIINTNGKAQDISAVQNGFLGWHYVDKIDTTVYVSAKYERDIGEQTIVWDGTDQDGNVMAADTYDYYLWGYDNKTERLLACHYMMIGYDWESQFTSIIEDGEDGLPLTQPMLFTGMQWWLQNEALAKDADGNVIPTYKHGTHAKWVLGGDPMDNALMQTTKCAIYLDDPSSSSEFVFGAPVLNPTDYSIFYHCQTNYASKINTMVKYSWVSEGEAILDEDWLGWDELTWEDKGCAIGIWSQKPSAYTDRQYIYIQSPGLHFQEEEWNKLRCVSFDGEVIFDKMMHEWYYPDDPNPHGTINGAFHHMYSRTPYEWALQGHDCCMQEMINTSRIIDDPEIDAVDYVIWQNGNGDYFIDNAYQGDVDPAWFCNSQRKGIDPRRESVSIDKNGFNITGVAYLGLASFGVLTQDGTGIDLMAFADETDVPEGSVLIKGGGLCCDSGSSYDGLYWSGPVTTETEHWDQMMHIFYGAFDSFHGVLTNEPVIEPGVETGQAAFSVAQNSPNPFNPTTSISFTIPEANHVTVEVYNVAGQKIDTLVNDFMDAGKHSVVLDASGFSNGVYFYTVKSGDFSKTMKMTLLK